MTTAEQHRLAQLTTETRERVEKLLAAMGARGLSVFVGATARTAAEQAAAQARGTTSAHQSRSWHQLGRAADLRKRLPNGLPDETTKDEAFFRALYDEATALGLRSLAYHVVDGQVVKLLLHTAKGTVWDAGHVEYREPFSTIDEAFAAEGGKVA